jgi:hypothetical protein
VTDGRFARATAQGCDGLHGWKRALARIVERSHPNCRKPVAPLSSFHRIIETQKRDRHCSGAGRRSIVPPFHRVKRCAAFFVSPVSPTLKPGSALQCGRPVSTCHVSPARIMLTATPTWTGPWDHDCPHSSGDPVPYEPPPRSRPPICVNLRFRYTQLVQELEGSSRQ